MDAVTSEVWSWRLAAAIAAAYPAVHLAERHPGGGQYDVLETQVDVGSDAPVVIQHNREGRVHRFTADGDLVWSRDVVADLLAGLPLQAATERVLGGAPSRSPDGGVACRLELMAELIARANGAGRRASWRWGLEDTSGEQGGPVRDELVRAVPATRSDVQRAAAAAPLPGPCPWFLVADEGVPLALEPFTGTVYIGEEQWPVDGSEDRLRALIAPAPRSGRDATPKQAAEANRRAFTPVGEDLARQVGATEAFRTDLRLSERGIWRGSSDDQLLVVVLGEHEPPSSVAEMLGYALAWQGDRDLVIVVPEERATAVLDRLAWVDAPVRVATYWHDRRVRAVAVPPRDEVLDRAEKRPVRGTKTHDLSDQGAAVAALVRHLDGHWALVSAHRSSYLSWHCRGRQVVQLRRVPGGVRILAGVQYKTPPRGREPVELVVNDRLGAEDRARIEAAVAVAVADRIAGDDVAHVEQRFQAALAADGGLMLGMVALQRELPAWRLDGGTGYVDFLGLDMHGELHVVETKVGTDVGVALQALDYAVWVQAHERDLREELGWPAGKPGARIHLDLVLGARKGRAVDSYLAGQLEALAGDVSWRIVLCADPVADRPTLQPVPRRQLPEGPLVAPAVQPPRWARHVQDQLGTATGLPHPDPAAALLPAARAAYENLDARGLLHRYVLHPRSSQAFALNLFAPLDDAGVSAVLAGVGLPVETAQPVTFEWTDSSDRLQEATPGRPHQTQVDVIMQGTRADGGRVAALVEVKLSETDFGWCSAWHSSANPWRDVCRSAGAFGGEPTRCFQLAAHGNGRRRYDEALTETQPPDGVHAGCTLRTGTNQPMRNLALAEVLLTDHGIAQAAYVLCAPSGHTAMWRRLDEVAVAFPDTPSRRITRLPAEAVVQHHGDGGAAFRSRYAAVVDSAQVDGCGHVPTAGGRSAG